MKPFYRTPLFRSGLVVLVALAAVVALSACLARSAPTPKAPAETEATEAPEPTEAAEPTDEPEPTEAARPAAQPGAVDLGVSAWHDDEITPGGRVTYHVSCENYDAERAAAGAVLKVALPEGATLTGSTSDEQPIKPAKAAGRELEYALPPIEPGDYREIVLAVQMPARFVPGSQVALRARLAGSAPDPDEETNYAEDAEEIPAPSLSVVVRPSGECGPFAPGRTVSYLVSYGNWSQAEAQSVAITGTLSAGMTFRSAKNLTEEKAEAITPKVAGPNLSFDLGTLAPEAYGDLLVEVGLDSRLLPEQPLTYTVGIAAPELDPGDNWAEDVQYAQVEGPDVWVELESSSDGEIGGAQIYSIYWGNRGTEGAQDIVVSLTIPSLLRDVTFTTEPTSLAGGVATWTLGSLEASTAGESIGVDATIDGRGQATAKATIRSRQDVDPRNDSAEASDELLTLRVPTIAGPADAIVGAQPAFFGLGKPEATVSLYISGTEQVPGGLLGTAVVDENSRWVITPTAKIEQPGYYWFTATQQLGDLVSPWTGAMNLISDTLGLDTNSMTIDGERLGGIDQPFEWRIGVTYTLGTRIIRCADPLTPTLLARYYNDQGLMVNHQRLEPTRTGPGGWVEFEFLTPEDLSFDLELDYYCRPEQTAAQPPEAAMIHRRRVPGLAASPVVGWLPDWLNPDCWFGGCDKGDKDKKKPDAPKPNPKCPDCKPLPRPGDKKKPKPKDPDGYVYDEAAVEAGAKMTQAIISSAWVTCTRQTAEGEYEPWNAVEYDQVNPQFTDTKYPDKVPKPGYYSFLVPPGSYRIRATAPGYLPYVSQIVQVVNDPVTVHIPLKRGESGIPKVIGTKSP